MIRRSFFSAVVALTATALVGCSGTDGGLVKPDDARAIVVAASEHLREIGATENAAALEDGVISMDEYLLAAGRYQTCLRELGIVIGGPGLSPVDNVSLLWDLPDDVAGGEDVAAGSKVCADHWLPVAGAYLDSHEQRMNDDLQKSVSTCMTTAGYDLSGEEETVPDFMGPSSSNAAQTRRQADAEQCIIRSSQQLYPELPGVTVVY